MHTPAPTSQLEMTDEQRAMWTLFARMRDYKDEHGRTLIKLFSRLPSKLDLPDYYDAIKKPMDMSKIYTRLIGPTNKYESYDALVSDFWIMFDNACRYNEPDSVLYKDALALLKVLIEAKDDLFGRVRPCTGVAEARTFVTQLIVQLTNAVEQTEDVDGRRLSDSFSALADLAVARDAGVERATVLTLDAIVRNVRGARYKRLDRFQVI
jgi:protein polybromo-1